MTNVMDAFAHLDEMTPTQLFERRTTLIGAAPGGDYRTLSDETLQELVAIARVLRRKSSTASSSKTPGRKAAVVPSLDAI